MNAYEKAYKIYHSSMGVKDKHNAYLKLINEEQDCIILIDNYKPSKRCLFKDLRNLIKGERYLIKYMKRYNCRMIYKVNIQRNGENVVMPQNRYFSKWSNVVDYYKMMRKSLMEYSEYEFIIEKATINKPFNYLRMVLKYGHVESVYNSSMYSENSSLDKIYDKYITVPEYILCNDFSDSVY